MKRWLAACMVILAWATANAAGGTSPLAEGVPANPYGTGLYAYSIINNLDENGLYSFSMDGKNTKIWASPFNDAYLFNGWLKDGRVCGINMMTSDGAPSLLRYNEYDFETGAVLASKVLDASNLMNFFKYCVYLPEKNQIFGVGVDEKNWSCVKTMNMDNFLDSEEQPEVTVVKNINYTQYILSICYNPIDKQVYAIDESNNMVRVNQETGDYETLVHIPGQAFATDRPQGLVYLPNKDEYLFAGMWNDLSTHLYRIDLTEKKVIEVGEVENDPYLTFFINTQEIDDMVPARPKFVSMSFPNGSLKGDIVFNMPSVLANGQPAPESLDWRLLVDGQEVATGQSSSAAEVSANVTLTQSTHTVEMMAINNGHEGPSAKTEIFVGNDTPKAPANVVLQEGKVTWDAVSEGVNGGYINLSDLTYEVYINDKYIGETDATEITFTVDPDDSFSRHVAEVRAISNDLESESGVSEPAYYGKPMKLDVHFDCNSREDASFFTSASQGEYYPAWGFNMWQEAFATSKGYYAGEAWLVTPPINFDNAEALYSLTFDLKEEDEWGESPVFAAYLVSPDDPTVSVATINEKFSFPASFQWGTVEKQFTVPAAGVYCVAFVSKQAAQGNTSMMKNMTIARSSMAPNAPDAPAEFTAAAAEGGALKALVSFNMPAKDVTGKDIPADAVITATLNCGENVASATGAPASAQTVEIATMQGDNEISASFAIGDAVGMGCKTTVFTGKDVPAAPTDVVAEMAADNRTVTLKWNAPTAGANGHYFNTEGLKYSVTSRVGWSWQELAAVEEGATQVTFELPQYDALTLLNLRIVASNEIGNGNFATAAVCTGTPYTLPMNEHFKDVDYYTYGPVYLETPSAEYSAALLYFVPPYQLSGPFEDKTEHGSIAVFPGAYGESRSRVALPKFSTKTDEDKSVKLSFEVYAGEAMAEDISFYAVTYDQEAPVFLGKVEPADGWTTVDFYLPSELMNKDWVNIYVDSRHPKDGTFMIIYGYDFDSVMTGVDGVQTADGAISASGSYVYFNNLAGENYAVYTLDGKLVKAGTIDCAQLAVGLDAGVYVAKAGSKTLKVIVK